MCNSSITIQGRYNREIRRRFRFAELPNRNAYHGRYSLREEEMVVVVAPGHPLASDKSVALQDLNGFGYRL